MSTPLPNQTQEIHLAYRPHGEPTPENFQLVTHDIPELQDGEILIENTVMSVDPYMRGRMNDVKSYVPPFQISAPLDGGAVGTVIASKDDNVPVGSSVLHSLGWREHAITNGRSVRVVDTETLPDSAYLGVAGMPGMTAYAGLMLAGEFQEGDTVFVSGAAGAVGSMVGQIAKLSGAGRVIGSAGTPEKITRLKELGFDAGFNYKDGNITEQLAEAAPGGVDLYYDNVGGDHLEAALANMNVDGRITMCGAISQYNATEPACAPRNLTQMIGKRITMRGFVIAKYADQVREEFQEKISQWVANGSVTWDETYRDGLESAPQAFIDMLGGANTGKMLVRLNTEN